MRDSQKEQYIHSYFEPKGFQRVKKRFQGSPKLILNVFPEHIRREIEKYSGGEYGSGPDFALVTGSHIEHEFGGQVIAMLEETRFSLWSIVENSESIFPFTPLRKNGQIIRTPDFRKNIGAWEATSQLMIR